MMDRTCGRSTAVGTGAVGRLIDGFKALNNLRAGSSTDAEGKSSAADPGSLPCLLYRLDTDTALKETWTVRGQVKCSKAEASRPEP